MTTKSPPASQDVLYLVDDDASFLESLKNALGLAGFSVIAFSHVSDFLNAPRSTRAVVICDMRMPGLNGLDLQEANFRQGYNHPLIFVSGESTVSQAVSALKNGAIDFLTKPFDPADLIKKIEHAFATYDRDASKRTAEHILSPREFTAFNYFVQGYGNAYVAEKMAIKISTVKEFKTNIFRKLNVSSVSELIETFKDKPI